MLAMSLSKALYRVSLILLLIGFVQFVLIQQAHAADSSDTLLETPVTLDELSPAVVSMLLGLFLPLLVAIFTKYDVAPGVRIWVNMFLSAAAGVVGTLVASDGGFAWVTFILSSIAAFMTSALLYMGVYKPTGAAQNLAAATGTFGVGTTRTPNEDPANVVPPVVEGSPVDQTVLDSIKPDEGDKQDG